MPGRSVPLNADRIDDSDRIAIELEQAQRDLEYLASVYDEFQRKYPNQWLAVFNEQVVAVAEDPDDVYAALKSAGVPLGQAMVMPLIGDDRILVL